MRQSLRQSFLIVICLIVGACASCSAAPQPQPIMPAEPAAPPAIEQADIQRALDAAITIYKADKREGWRSICSGARVSPTRIVTAYHCAVVSVLPPEMIELVSTLDPLMRHVEIEGMVGSVMHFAHRADEDAQEAKVVAYDAAHDMVILSTAKSSQPAVNVRSERGEVGEDVFAIGNPLGQRYTFTRGWISYSCREDEPGACYAQTDITSGPGSSGGGLYDANGRLMGLCSAGYSEMALAYFTDSVALAKLVGEHLL